MVAFFFYFIFIFFLLQHKEHYLQNKTYTTYNTTYNTLLILHYLLYNTSLDQEPITINGLLLRLRF